jgi:hypothetical protein
MPLIVQRRYQRLDGPIEESAILGPVYRVPTGHRRAANSDPKFRAQTRLPPCIQRRPELHRRNLNTSETVTIRRLYANNHLAANRGGISGEASLPGAREPAPPNQTSAQDRTEPDASVVSVTTDLIALRHRAMPPQFESIRS